MIKKEIIKQTVWYGTTNIKTKKTIYHGYIPMERLTKFGGLTKEKINGNSRLCQKRWGVKNSNGDYVSTLEMENIVLNRKRVCKRCLKFFDIHNNK